MFFLFLFLASYFIFYFLLHLPLSDIQWVYSRLCKFFSCFFYFYLLLRILFFISCFIFRSPISNESIVGPVSVCASVRFRALGCVCVRALTCVCVRARWSANAGASVRECVYGCVRRSVCWWIWLILWWIQLILFHPTPPHYSHLNPKP